MKRVVLQVVLDHEDNTASDDAERGYGWGVSANGFQSRMVSLFEWSRLLKQIILQTDGAGL